MIFTATSSRGTESVLLKELRQIGLQRTTLKRRVVEFHGSLQAGLRACLWSRIASRILLRLSRFQASTADDLYAGIKTIRWIEHLSPTSSIWIDFVGGSKHIRHSQFGARRAKDAIVDQLRTSSGQRPSVSQENPDLRIHIHMRNAVVTVSIDLSGAALHRRTPYRQDTGAPIKENLAAALLHMGNWPQRSKAEQPLFDPMCGSGTFLLEGGGIAADIAPGLHRMHWGFSRWKAFQPEVWEELKREALERKKTGLQKKILIFGSDLDPQAIKLTRQHLHHAGFANLAIHQAPLASLCPPHATPGLLIANPPYGERMGFTPSLHALYQELGNQLRRNMLGWQACILAPANALSRTVGLKSLHRHIVYNGPLECRLLVFDIHSAPPQGDAPSWVQSSSSKTESPTQS